MQAATKVQITLIPDAQPKSLHGPCQKQTFVRKPGASRPGGPEEHDGKVTDPAPPPLKVPWSGLAVLPVVLCGGWRYAAPPELHRRSLARLGGDRTRQPCGAAKCRNFDEDGRIRNEVAV